jgi:hypothetical protein
MNHRVELWTRDGQHVRWAIAATASITVGQAAFDAAVNNWPHERFTLRKWNIGDPRASAKAG